MNDFEKQCLDALARQGHKVLRNGWPDFMVVSNRRGVPAVCAVEVKRGADCLNADQRRMHAVLISVGIPVHVIRESELAEIDSGSLMVHQRELWNLAKCYGAKPTDDLLRIQARVESLLDASHSGEREVAARPFSIDLADRVWRAL